MSLRSSGTESRCQIVRTLDIVGEKWSLLIIRDALRGRTRFSEFRESLGAPSDILTSRLVTLVDAGVLEKRAYREPGSRERSSYHLTERGLGLKVVIAAMMQWGDEFNPSPRGSASALTDAATHDRIGLAFVDTDGHAIDDDQVEIISVPALASI